MCSHYEAPSPQRVAETFGVEPFEQGKLQLYPGYTGPFIRRAEHVDEESPALLEALTGAFGLIPTWSKDTKIVRSTYNCRSETASQKPSYRTAWRKAQHCIIPAAAIYEPDWRTGKPIATRIVRADGELMGIPEDEKRMLVILPRGLYGDWLNAGADDSMEFMRQYPADRMAVAGWRILRTACFVDGYNLFYGLLAGTQYKWLDLPGLLAHIIRVEHPENTLDAVSFFTSGVKPSLATRGIASKEAQDTYLRALIALDVSVFYGRHQLESGKAPRFIDKYTPASRTDQVEIWKLEEKETDVHIAISMYRLAARQATLPPEQRIEQLVLVSADTDMTPALRALREDFPELNLGVILPHREGIQRAVPGSLKQYATWMRHVVKNVELAQHQLPSRIPTRKKPIDKPDYW
eukprot:gene20234-24046_t